MEQKEKWSADDLLAYLDVTIRKVSQDERSRPRTINTEQCKVLKTVCDTMTNIFGAEAEVKTYPISTAGGVVVSVSNIDLDPDKISELRSMLDHCTTLAIEPLTNGKIETSVTVPGIFVRGES